MDTAETTPTHSDLFTPEQWADVLDAHAEVIAKKFGAYSFHHDLRFAAECIRDLVKENKRLDNENADLMGLSRSLSELSQRLTAGVESLSKLP